MSKTASRRGASPKARPARQVPGWVWMFTGVITGLFIAFLYHLAQLRLNPPTNRPTTEVTETAPSGSEEDRPRFDFYAVLPQMEVIVPKGDEQEERQIDDSDPDTLAHRHNEQFLLQAGSFRTSTDADRRRAELILQGFEVGVQRVELQSGDVWHRVMVGPFTNANTMLRAQDKLVAAGIETLPIRVRQTP